MIPLDADREIYPNAPLKLVTFEMRFQAAGPSRPQTDAFVETLRDRFPISAPPAAIQVVLGAPGGAPAAASGVRLFDTSRHETVAFGPHAVAYETSRYRRFEEFGGTIRSVLEVVDGLELGLAPRRIGLRYIDEVDVERLPEPGAWDRYIEPALASPLSHFTPAPVEHQSAALFEPDDGRRIVLRYGLMRQHAVDPTGPLVIDSPPRGPYYLIDIDSSWEDATADTMPTSAAWVIEMLAELHAPIRVLFESSITETLRNEVLRRP
jgi:uncharacterized protein (TIGR04255 family)